ncbi:hypothetical protein HERIO_1131 [Hepatospora eriocheir]|uniref:Uncharacterized protein n=1 Tax=Hepatospora eriocheir TaxID=1081669 RepID=A0A1X0QB28_9MICR|nr:hypothetical protein HERIO_1131 [Hepatospora eriocheir]
MRELRNQLNKLKVLKGSVDSKTTYEFFTILNEISNFTIVLNSTSGMFVLGASFYTTEFLCMINKEFTDTTNFISNIPFDIIKTDITKNNLIFKEKIFDLGIIEPSLTRNIKITDFNYSIHLLKYCKSVVFLVKGTLKEYSSPHKTKYKFSVIGKIQIEKKSDKISKSKMESYEIVKVAE